MQRKKKVTKKKKVVKKKATKTLPKFVRKIVETPRLSIETKPGRFWTLDQTDPDEISITVPCGDEAAVTKEDWVALREGFDRLFGTK